MDDQGKYEMRARLGYAWIAGNRAVLGEEWSPELSLHHVLKAYSCGLATRDIVIGVYGVVTADVGDDVAEVWANEVISVIGGGDDD